MIKYFCDLCDGRIRGTQWNAAEQVMYKVEVTSQDDGSPRERIRCVCPGCASVIMDTVSKLRVEES